MALIARQGETFTSDLQLGGDMTNDNRTSADLCAEAMELLKRGLNLLDQADAPDELGAHVDLAIRGLEDRLKQAA
jgi:hypothetical protein